MTYGNKIISSNKASFQVDLIVRLNKFIKKDLLTGRPRLNNEQWVPVLSEIIIAHQYAKTDQERIDLKNICNAFFGWRFASNILFLESVRKHLLSSGKMKEDVADQVWKIFQTIVFKMASRFSNDENRTYLATQLSTKAQCYEHDLEQPTVESIERKLSVKFLNKELRLFRPNGDEVCNFKEAIEIFRRTNVAVGIPSYSEGGAIQNPTEKIFQGLCKHFSREDVVLIGNFFHDVKDNTSVHFINKIKEQATISPNTNIYSLTMSTGTDENNHPILGKGNNLRNFFEVLHFGNESQQALKGAAVIDADLKTITEDGETHGITPEWIRELLYPIIYPVFQEPAQFVTPLYSRHEYDGSLTDNFIVGLMMLASGKYLRQPIGGDFGFAPVALRHFLYDMDWVNNVQQFGIDISMSLTAVINKLNVIETNLGEKIHNPVAPKLSFMVPEVLGAAIRILIKQSEQWGKVSNKSYDNKGEGFRPKNVLITPDYSSLTNSLLRLYNLEDKQLVLEKSFMAWDEILAEASNWGLSVEELIALLPKDRTVPVLKD